MQSFYQAETPVRRGGEGDVEPGHHPSLHQAAHPCHGLLSENIHRGNNISLFICMLSSICIYTIDWQLILYYDKHYCDDHYLTFYIPYLSAYALYHSS